MRTALGFVLALAEAAAAAANGPDSPVSDADRGRPAVVAEVNGRAITFDALDRRAARPLVSAAQSIARLRRLRLEAMIEDVLLQQEASRRNLPIDALVADITGGHPMEVSDAEAEEFYLNNRERFPTGVFAGREAIRAAVREEKARAKLEPFVEGLRSGTRVVTFPFDAPAPGGVVAEVNGTPISLKAVDEEIRKPLAELESIAYQRRKTALDALIDEMLAEDEARRRGITRDALFEAVTGADTLTVPADQVEMTYRRMTKRGTRPEDPALKDTIIRRLRHRQALPVWKQFIETLKSRAVIKTYLKPPGVMPTD
jgi:hypothetical protein